MTPKDFDRIVIFGLCRAHTGGKTGSLYPHVGEWFAKMTGQGFHVSMIDGYGHLLPSVVGVAWKQSSIVEFVRLISDVHGKGSGHLFSQFGSMSRVVFLAAGEALNFDEATRRTLLEIQDGLHVRLRRDEGGDPS